MFFPFIVKVIFLLFFESMLTVVVGTTTSIDESTFSTSSLPDTENELRLYT